MLGHTQPRLPTSLLPQASPQPYLPQKSLRPVAYSGPEANIYHTPEQPSCAWKWSLLHPQKMTVIDGCGGMFPWQPQIIPLRMESISIWHSNARVRNETFVEQDAPAPHGQMLHSFNKTDVFTAVSKHLIVSIYHVSAWNCNNSLCQRSFAVALSFYVIFYAGGCVFFVFLFSL